MCSFTRSLNGLFSTVHKQLGKHNVNLREKHTKHKYSVSRIMIIKGCVSDFVTLIYCKSRIYVFAPAFKSVLLLLAEVQINKKLCSTIRYSCIRDPNCTCSFFFVLLVTFGIGGTMHQYNPFSLEMVYLSCTDMATSLEMKYMLYRWRWGYRY